MKKETEQKIGQLQMMEQNLQNFLIQKQQFQAHLIEVESALKEIQDKKEAYKIVGNIMVAAKKEELEEELNQKKDTLQLRIKTLEKQENIIKEKTQSIRKEVMKELAPK